MPNFFYLNLWKVLHFGKFQPSEYIVNQDLIMSKWFEDSSCPEYYSKTCLMRPLKKDKTKVLIANGSLMKVESSAECSPWSILQYFWPALRDNRSWKPIWYSFWVAA